MSAVPLPFVVDEQALEQQERTLAVSGEARLTGLVHLAWHLRQRDGKRAAELAREARGLMPQLGLAEARARATAMRLSSAARGAGMASSIASSKRPSGP